MNSEGANTPPLPPDEMVKEVLSTLKNMIAAMRPMASSPIIAFWIHPYPIPSAWGATRPTRPTKIPPMAGLRWAGTLILPKKLSLTPKKNLM